METINNATTAIKNTIWGEGEGNSTGGGLTGSGTHTETHKSMIDDSITESKSYSGKTESDPMAEGSYDPDKRDTDKGPAGPQSTGGQPQGANLTNEQNTNDHPMSNSNEPNTGFGGAGAQPSVSADTTSGQQPTPKQQGADRPTEEPETGSGESGQSGTSGPPKPSGGSSGPGGMKLPDSDNQSKGEGTGTKYEKSTGLHADGGDFDATRPGAAKEAERLMDEAGIKHGETPGKPGGADDDKKEKKWYGVDHSGFGGHGSHQNKRGSVSSQGGSAKGDNDDHVTSTSADVDDDGTGKKGLGQKIKDKLHH